MKIEANASFQNMKIELIKRVYENPVNSERSYLYVPIIDVLLVGNHKVGKSIKSYLDTGSYFNIFPSEYATALLGYSDITLKKGVVLQILGVGGMKTVGYGHRCSIQHPEFELKDVMIYFVKGQPYPLLGRVGFMDQFKKIVFNEDTKILELLK